MTACLLHFGTAEEHTPYKHAGHRLEPGDRRWPFIDGWAEELG